METVIERVENKGDLRKPYVRPEIIQELELETRAGSTYPTIEPFLDPLDTN
jgi:hypothetical protein